MPAAPVRSPGAWAGRLGRPALLAVLSLAAILPARAQLAAPGAAASPAPAELTPAAADTVTTLDNLGAFAPQPPPVPPVPLVPPAPTAGYVPHMGVFDTIRESLLGDAYAKPSTWHPLPLTTFFTEGWDEAFVNPIPGSGGATRQGWINSFEGTFFRVWFLLFSYQNELRHDGNGYLGQYTIFVPLNRRLEIRFDVPFVVSNKGGPSNTYHNNFGDMFVSPRFLLSESQDFSQIFALNIRTPTGSTVNRNGVSTVSPHYQFWVNVAGPWVVRGGTGITIPTNRESGRDLYFADLSIGRYWEGAENALFHQFWVYLCANLNTPIDSSGPKNVAFLGLTPGFRFQIYGTWYFLAGVEVPVIGPKAFEYSPLVFLLKSY
jgi:hypothetical protein